MADNDFMKITVAGVGCGGNNSVCRVAEAKSGGITYFGIDTDSKALRSEAVTPVHLGAKHGSGRGCGGNQRGKNCFAEFHVSFSFLYLRETAPERVRRL